MDTCPLIGRQCSLFLCRRHWMRALRQRQESLSELNRYYFGLAHGRPARDDEELLAYYVESGGARDFRLREEEVGLREA